MVQGREYNYEFRVEVTEPHILDSEYENVPERYADETSEYLAGDVNLNAYSTYKSDSLIEAYRSFEQLGEEVKNDIDYTSSDYQITAAELRRENVGWYAQTLALGATKKEILDAFPAAAQYADIYEEALSRGKTSEEILKTTQIKQISLSSSSPDTPAKNKNKDNISLD